jgi:hypothetical protein
MSVTGDAAADRTRMRKRLTFRASFGRLFHFSEKRKSPQSPLVLDPTAAPVRSCRPHRSYRLDQIQLMHRLRYHCRRLRHSLLPRPQLLLDPVVAPAGTRYRRSWWRSGH